MPKANGYRGWYVPDYATVVVDGEIVPVPHFPISVRNCIIHHAKRPDTEVPVVFSKWLEYRSTKELQAIYHYFLDRWTWDTGCDYDKYFYTTAEWMITQRKELISTLATLHPISELEEDFRKMNEAAEKVMTAMKVPSALL